MENKKIIDTPSFSYVLEKKRIKNLYIRIKNNTVYVSAPFLMNFSQINEFVISNEKLIMKQLNKINKPEKWAILGNECTKDDYNEYLKYSAYNYLSGRVEYFYSLMNIEKDIPPIKIKKIKSAYGIYHSKENYITFSSVILKYNKDIIDYVVVHELSHMKYMNHSKYFWNEVSKYIPNYKILRRTLKKGE